MFDDILNQVIIAIIIIGILVFLYYNYANEYKSNPERLGDLALMKFHITEYNEFEKYTNVKVHSTMIDNQNNLMVTFECQMINGKKNILVRNYTISDQCDLADLTCIDLVMKI